jgi:hypothetical protein
MSVGLWPARSLCARVCFPIQKETQLLNGVNPFELTSHCYPKTYSDIEFLAGQKYCVVPNITWSLASCPTPCVRHSKNKCSLHAGPDSLSASFRI